MNAEQLLAALQRQLARRPSPAGHEVVLRAGGRDYAIRSMDASRSSVILEGGEEIIHEDARPGIGEVPGGPEGEGVEPPAPGEEGRL
jgi:hypothetical protein